jgi:hypothetical protein
MHAEQKRASFAGRPEIKNRKVQGILFAEIHLLQAGTDRLEVLAQRCRRRRYLLLNYILKPA